MKTFVLLAALILSAIPIAAISTNPTADKQSSASQTEKIVYGYFTTLDDDININLSVMRLKIADHKVIAYTFNTVENENEKWHPVSYLSFYPTTRTVMLLINIPPSSILKLRHDVTLKSFSICNSHRNNNNISHNQSIL